MWSCFALGLGLSLLLWARSQVGGDQLNLLARGWLLAVRGVWISYGNPMSTGGKAPGGITSLLVGWPLLLWRDHRAPTLVVVLCHVGAFLILDATLKRVLGARERALFAVLYWLNPWRLYFSGFLWNPNYLYLFGAIHLATTFHQRRRKSFWLSLLHVLSLGLALQIHASSLLLLAASALLWLRGYWKLDRWGAAAGFLLANLPLLPWYRDVALHPALLAEANKGFPGRGLLLLFPLVRGVLYWLRYSSLSLSGRMGIFDFKEALGAAADRWLQPLFFFLSQIVAPATIPIPLAANLWLARRNRLRLRSRFPAAAPDRAWLHGYVAWTFLALVLILALSPTTFMYWQGLILLHVAVLPLVLWAGALRRTRLGGRVAAGLWTYAALEVVLVLGMAFGSPDYRCAGTETVVFPLRSHSPMFEDLHVQATCPWPLDQPGGWWPDVLPKAGE